MPSLCHHQILSALFRVAALVREQYLAPEKQHIFVE